MAEKSSLIKGAPSSDGMAWGAESADNAIAAATIGSASRQRGGHQGHAQGREAQAPARKKSWVKRRTKRCKERCPRVVRVVSLANSVLSLALYAWTW